MDSSTNEPPSGNSIAGPFLAAVLGALLSASMMTASMSSVTLLGWCRPAREVRWNSSANRISQKVKYTHPFTAKSDEIMSGQSSQPRWFCLFF